METQDNLDAARGPVASSGPRAWPNRQARVGILRNPNAPRVPPPHRPPLVGKWMRLRSSRRPPAQANDQGSGATAPAGGPTDLSLDSIVARDGDAIRRIDLDLLARAVDGLGQTQSSRRSIAEHVTDPTPMQDPAGRPVSGRTVARTVPPPTPGRAEPPEPETRPDTETTGSLRANLSRLLRRG